MDVVPTIETPAGDEPLFDGRYRVLRELGRGGFGRVLLVEDMLHSGQVRALKTVLPVRQAHGDFERRFRNEIQVMRSLQHPGIPQIYNDGKTAEGEFYFTMRFVEGRPFSRVLTEQGALESLRVARILRQIVDVLDFAHGKGVIHRDLKPDNILLEDDDSVRVLDFGIAKILEHEGDLEDAVSMQTQAPIGTPHYMSPEQVSGGDIDGSTDVYALGILVYQLLSGRFPFQGTTYMELMAARLHERPEPLSRKLEPTWARELVPRLMDRDASKRPTAAQLREELDAVIEGKAAPAASGKGRAYALAAGLGAAALAVVAAIVLSGDPADPVEPTDDDVETADVTPKPEDRTIDDAQGRESERDSNAAPIGDDEEGGVTPNGEEEDDAGSVTEPKQDEPSDADGAEADSTPRSTVERTNDSPPATVDGEGDDRADDEGDEPVQDESTAATSGDDEEAADSDRTGSEGDVVDEPAAPPGPEEEGQPEDKPEPPRALPTGTVAVGDALSAERWPMLIEHEASGLQFVFVNAGSWQGGDGLITTPRPLYLSRTEVSRDAYGRYCDAFRLDRPDAPRDSDPIDGHPIVKVTRDDALHFSEWCGGRLPTVMELRWAATGPEGREYPWGEGLGNGNANFKGDADGYEHRAPVDAFADGASWCGALNLCGNVAEWVADERFLFGGSYRSNAASPRAKPEPTFIPSHAPDLGIRVVVDLPKD